MQALKVIEIPAFSRGEFVNCVRLRQAVSGTVPISSTRGRSVDCLFQGKGRYCASCSVSTILLERTITIGITVLLESTINKSKF